MKLAVSNIAWDEPEHSQVLELLRSRSVSGIEVAPTKLWPDWQGADRRAAERASRDFTSQGFSVPALQAILFARPDLKVFGSAEQRRQLLAHIGLVASIAGGFGAQVLVFGSPKNRDRGSLSMEQALSQAVEFFTEAGEVCAAAGVRLCIEPNPKAYACNFITGWREAEELVRRIAHPGIGLHLDTGCIHMAGDDPIEAIMQCADITAHFHISEPGLADLSAPAVDHASVGRALVDSGYRGWVSIEMRRSEHPLQSIAEAVDKAAACYISGSRR